MKNNTVDPLATPGESRIPPSPPPAPGGTIPDPRHISSGFAIPGRNYVDQPYIVKTDDGAWLCIMTTGTGKEGQPGQIVVSMRSADRGRTWDTVVPLEPDDGPEASYAVLLKTPYGRVYAFYNHNTDRVSEVKREDGGVYTRVDSLGHYVFKFSDDHGRTWSERRYEVPMREFACDRENLYGGKLKFFWNVGRPLVLDGAALLVMHKVGAFGHGFFSRSEGAFLRSPNILTERDPEKLVFETLPEGDIGLRTPPGGGPIAEEQSVAALSDGSLVCVYRTIDGWPAHAYSRDGGRNWSVPEYLAYTPGGRLVKHPRAANFVWSASNGKFLYWFHNHGGRFIQALAPGNPDGRSPYDDRNPVWLMAGREVAAPDGLRIEWSQPEILLYDDDPFIRMSYPDLVEEDGEFFVTETQKNIARTHPIPRGLLDGLFGQFEVRGVAAEGLALSLPDGGAMPDRHPMPRLPGFLSRDLSRHDHGIRHHRNGFSLELRLQPDSVEPGLPLLDTRGEEGRGVLVCAGDDGAIRIRLHDGRQASSWESDPGALRPGEPCHAVITADSGPKIITCVINGVLCDGGDTRQFGWGRFSPTLRDANGADGARIGPAVRGLRIYTRPLTTSEAVGNYRAAMGG